MSTVKFAKLRDRRVLLIGGTSGIGYAVAEGALEAGAVIVIAGSTTERLSGRTPEDWAEAAVSR